MKKLLVHFCVGIFLVKCVLFNFVQIMILWRRKSFLEDFERFGDSVKVSMGVPRGVPEDVLFEFCGIC